MSELLLFYDSQFAHPQDGPIAWCGKMGIEYPGQLQSHWSCGKCELLSHARPCTRLLIQ